MLRRFASDKEASAAQAPAQDPEQSRQLQRALAELPAPKRVVLILAEAEGLSGQEIARQLNIRLLVKTPDLEIEDQGTVFTVRVEGGVTQLVAVAQGRVAIRGAEPRVILLEAGERWTGAERWTGTERSATAHAEPAPGVVPAAKSRPGASSNPPPNPPLTPALNAEAEAFEAAMLSFRAGNWSQAVGLFRGFQASFPRSPRGEDASYLTVISLQRAGRQAELARAASAYLKQYPHGFRAREIQRLNGSP